MSKRGRVVVGFLLVLMALGTEAGSVFEVTTVSDSGAGSLREAIDSANASPGHDLIAFNIPEGSCSAAGVCMIPVLSDLPVITDAVTIDGTTQPRYGSAPENVCARPGIPSHMRVELAGAPFVIHLRLESAETSVLRGLSIGGGESGVYFQSPAAHWVHCNHIGVDATGTAQRPLTDAVCFSCTGGIAFGSPSVLGTNGDKVADLAERNVIAASFRGINHNSDSGYTVAGNYVGLGADGIIALPTPTCVFIRQGAKDNTYGSNLDGVADESERNILGDCDIGFELQTDPGGPGNIVAGNWIGLDAAGGAVGVQRGIWLHGKTQGARLTGNRIEGATEVAIRVEDSATVADGSDGNCIANNTLGLDHRGLVPGFDVTDNWWGDPSGPSGVGTGGGDGIAETTPGSVSFDPWLTAAPASCSSNLLHLDGFEGPDVD